jgi:tRNA pseudouridine55 synthase
MVLLRKPSGITSFQALSPLKRELGSGKIGHAGTLDKFASGLLVALAGSYSRLAPFVQAGEKRYRGLVAFGRQTDTLDPEGSVVAEAPIPSLEDLTKALCAFRGPIMQRPPAYSAVHVAGKRAYELALRGEEPELKERRVEIRALELLSYEAGRALIEVRCTSGTYIRSLARDIALACASCAYLLELERLSIGPYSVDEAVLPEAFEPERDLRVFTPSDASALGLRALGLGSPSLAFRFSNGGKLDLGSFTDLDGPRLSPGPDAAVFDTDGTILGILGLEAAGPRYKMVMPILEGEPS